MSGLTRTATGPLPVIAPDPSELSPEESSPTPPGNDGARAWAAIAALALGMFTLVTVEQLPIGVLTLMSDDLGVSRGSIGLAVTLPGILAGIIALLIPGLTSRLNRTSVLLASLGAVIVSCTMSALAPSFEILLASRILTGIAIGMYWPVLPLIAVAQVAPRHRASALTLAYAGISTALVLGLPLVTWLGTLVGWRGSFAATGAIALVTAIAITWLVTPVRSLRHETIRSTLGAIKIRGVRYAFVLTLIIVTAQFMSYSFISPLLQDIGHVPVEHIGAFLLMYGILGIAGNFAAGPLIRVNAALAVFILAGGVAGSLILVGLIMNSPTSALVIVGLWGLFAGMASVSIQALVNVEAGERVEAGTALNSAAYNAAIGLGAVLGGILVDTHGLTITVWISAAAMLASVLVIARLALHRP